MKVFHFYRTYFPDTNGGVEQSIRQMSLHTAPHGVDSKVLTLSPAPSKDPIKFEGHHVYQCQSLIDIASTPLSFSAFQHFKHLAGEADVIHYHFPYPFADLLHLCYGRKKPSIVTYHSDIVRQKKLDKCYRPLRNRFLNSVSKIVPTSPNYARTSPVLQTYKDKVQVIPLGLDKASYPPPTPDRLAYWSPKLGSKFFLFIGVLRYYKGLHHLLNSAPNTPYPIVIAGSGPKERELKQQATSLGLTNIYFLGHISEEDKAALLHLCYGLIMPSHLRSEAFGISLLEGAMYGKPLICCEIGTGTSFVNRHEETGLVVPPNDPQALSQAMTALWNDETRAKSMGQKAQERFANHFTANKMGQSYAKLYQDIIDQ